MKTKAIAQIIPIRNVCFIADMQTRWKKKWWDGVFKTCFKKNKTTTTPANKGSLNRSGWTAQLKPMKNNNASRH